MVAQRKLSLRPIHGAYGGDKKTKEEVATEEDRNRRTHELLARMGATKDSVVLPVPPAACADIARCRVFPRTHNPSPLARLLRQIFIESQKASVKTGVIQNRLIQKKSPPSRLE